MLRYRPAKTRDIPEAVSQIAAHPVIAGRYDGAIAELEQAWLRLLPIASFKCLVCEDLSQSPARMIGSYCASFVTDEFAKRIAALPLQWIGRSLVKSVTSGPRALLTDAELVTHNSTGGLNLVIWPSGPIPEYEYDREFRMVSQSSFHDSFRGYHLKRLQAQASHPMEMVMAVNSGGWLLRNPGGQYERSINGDAQALFSEPHLLEVTEQTAAEQPGAWVSLFFAHRKPTIGFSRSQQRLLCSALAERTDEELAQELDTSLSTVKKQWAAIYLRVDSRKLKTLVLEGNRAVEGDRGKEKKRKLLAFLREHPEELRPYAMKK